MEAKVRDRRSFAVDKVNVRNELHRRGYTLSEASVKMGFSKSYLGAMLHGDNPRLPQTTLNHLWHIFGIRAEVIGRGYIPKPEDLKPIAEAGTEAPKPEEPKAPEAPATAKASVLDMTVREFIEQFGAVLNALRDATKGV